MSGHEDTAAEDERLLEVGYQLFFEHSLNEPLLDLALFVAMREPDTAPRG